MKLILIFLLLLNLSDANATQKASTKGACVLYTGIKEEISTVGTLGEEPDYSKKSIMKRHKCRAVQAESLCKENKIDTDSSSKLWHFYKGQKCNSPEIKSYLTAKDMNEGF